MNANTLTKPPHIDDERASSEAALARLAAVHASIVAEHAGDDLGSIIEYHRRTLASWLATAKPGEDLETEGPAYDAFERAEFAFVTYQCSATEEVQQKLRYVADCREMAQAIHADYDEASTSYQTLFLRSLTLPKIGENESTGFELDTISARMWELTQVLELLETNIREVSFNGLSPSQVRHLNRVTALASAATCFAEKVDASIDEFNAGSSMAAR